MFRGVFVLCAVAAVALTAKTKPMNAKKPKLSQLRPFLGTSELCEEFFDIPRWPHADSCRLYWECDGDNNIWEEECDPSTPVYDEELMTCVTEDELACWSEEPWSPDYPDSECPTDTNDIVFLPGEFCEEYIICINGAPNIFQCREGQHWNIDMNYCDNPHSAQCDDTAVEQLPDCETGFTGSVPHPHNCNWFVHCENGNRSIQQCQHLFHFDIVQNRCIILIAAKCIKD